MEKLLINHRRQLLFIALICFFAIFVISAGKIVVNTLGLENRINSVRYSLCSINKNIEPELPLVQRGEWLRYAENNSEEFLKANTVKDLNHNIIQSNTASNDIIASSFKNLLASIVARTREHLKNEWSE